MRILSALGALAIVLLIAFNALDPVQIERRQNQAFYEAERNRMTLDYQSLDLERYAATQPARIVSDYGFGVLLLVGCGSLLLIGYDAYRRRAVPLAQFGCNR